MTASNEERPRVLIVDDEKFIRDILADFLGMEGYVVRTAEDGQAALSELNHAHYDLVISDLGLPDGSGLDVARAVRKHVPRARAIAMSGYGMEDDRKKSAEAGFFDHLVKPVGFRELRAAIRRALSR